MARKSDKIIKLNLRLPEGLHRRLERASANHKQSLNTEMLERLERSFSEDHMREAAWKLSRHSTVDEALTRMIKKSVLEMAKFLMRVSQHEETGAKATKEPDEK